MILAVTGHRPDKIGGYKPNPLREWVRAQIRAALEDLKPERGITGMALGVDQDFAEACVALGIPFTAAVPFEGQESRWPPPSRRFYHQLIEQAAEVVYVSELGYARWKMEARNHWMVDHSDRLLAIWDGTLGGTGGTVLYAERVGRPIQRIDPKDFKENQ